MKHLLTYALRVAVLGGALSPTFAYAQGGAPAAEPTAPPPVVEPPPVTPQPPAPPASAGSSLGGFLDFNFYPYLSEVSADSVLTLNIFSKLPYGFHYASLLNVINQDRKDPFHDTNGYYTEQNLRWAPLDAVPFDLTAQYNMRGGLENDRLRFGTRWRVEATPLLGDVLKAISLSYSITFHLLQIDHVTDNYVWQIEHIFRLDTPWLDRRLYIGGFVDHSINEQIPGVHSTPAVVEIQAGLRLIDELHAICELRANEYREPSNNEINVALGAEYVIKW